MSQPKDFVKSFTHTLVQPFSYADKGMQAEAQTVVVNAPTAAMSQFTSLIETEFNKGMMELSLKFKDQAKEKGDKKEDDEDEQSKRDTIYTILSSYADLNKCYLSLRSILTSKGQALADGAQPLTVPLHDSMSLADTREILVSYILNFLNTSLSS